MIDYGLNELLEKIKKAYPKAHNLIIKSSQLSGEDIANVILDILPLNGRETKQLRSMYPFLFLPKSERDRLQEIITNSQAYNEYVKFKDLYNSEDEKKLVGYFAQKIYDSSLDKDKKHFSISDIANTLNYFPVMNLGVIETPRANMNFRGYMKENISFFRDHREIGARVLINYFMKKGEMIYNGNLENFIKDSEQELKEMGAFEK